MTHRGPLPLGASPPADPEPHRTPSVVRRSPLALRIVVVAAILIVLSMVLRPGEIWTSDEGAVRAQVVMLADGTWSAERPLSEFDPEEVLSPIHGSSIEGDRYHPYTKQPLWPMLLAPIQALWGSTALIALNLVAVIGTALIGSKIAERFEPRAGELAFWFLALASPVTIYGFTVLGHALATMGTAAVALAAISGPRSARWAVLASAAGAVAVAIRPEALLYLLALAIAVGWVGWRMDRPSWRFVAAVGASGIAAFIANAVTDAALGGPTPAEGGALVDLARVVRGGFSSLVLVDFGTSSVLIASAAMVAGCVLGALAVRREPDNRALHVAFAAIAVAGSIAILMMAPVPLGGLIVAFPGLAAGLAAVPRRRWALPEATTIGIASVLFLLAVIVTQEQGGGGVQYGGRYLMVMVPALAALAAVGGRRLLDDRTWSARLVVGAILVATCATVATGLSVVRNGRDGSVALAERMVAAATEAPGTSERPILMSTFTQVGRHGWRHLDDVDFVMIPEESLDRYLDRFAGGGVSGFAWFGPWDDVAPLFERSGFRAVVEDGLFTSVELDVDQR